MDFFFLIVTISLLWRWQSMRLASVVGMPRRRRVLLDWCDEATGSTSAKDLAYDVTNGSFPLASTVHFAIASIMRFVG